jgi:hypothetical protein
MTTIEKTAMSGSELKVQLGAMGIPPSWLAAHLKVTMRTVVRWFDSEAVSPQVVEAVELLRAFTDSEMARLRKAVDRRYSDPVILQTYRTDDEYVNPDNMPATWHRQVVYRLMEELRAEGKAVTVQYA